MNSYVLIVAIGPVQTFIAQARRTRDLWCGSWLLSELSKAVALELLSGGAELVFPSILSPDDLRPGSALSVANKIQVILKIEDPSSADATLRALAARARQSAQARWRALADEALSRLGDGAGIDLALWQCQVEDYVETYVAWASIDASGAYGSAVSRANEALAVRKATRDFAPGAQAGTQLPFFGKTKSSLDGARESVLPSARPGGARLRTRLRRQLSLQANEQLDCAGIVKRMAGDAEQFTALTRIAADPWLQALADSAPDRLRALSDACEPLVGLGLATRVRGNAGAYAAFPYDGQHLIAGRLGAALKDADEEGDPEAREALQHLRSVLLPIWKAFGEPCPYAVLLLADGDRMGALLDSATSARQHQDATRALSGFAAGVPAVVRAHRGHAVYSGGDDVLAMLPLPSAIDCAGALHALFDECLAPVARDLGASVPTLSVGLAIAHVLEPLGGMRDLAMRAEHLAKGDRLGAALSRNALGIVLSVRSGSIRELRLRWTDGEGREALRRWQDLYASREVPSRIAYDALAIAARHRGHGSAGGDESQSALSAEQAVAEWVVTLSRARRPDGRKLAREVRLALEVRGQTIPVEQLADELLISRWCAARTRAAVGDE